MSDETKITETPEPWVNLEDIAKHLSVSHDTIRTWIKKGKIPYSRTMRQYKFKISEVDEWVRQGKITE
ncbi:MAG: helix-turn-helix domain-containing protein [Oscillospiraceae bacterium]|jgi:excisionase family DNA binding protein|nr:helix-turn-helix domain-containing protein [Oscillospiraceae bacterium]